MIPQKTVVIVRQFPVHVDQISVERGDNRQSFMLLVEKYNEGSPVTVTQTRQSVTVYVVSSLRVG